MCAGQELLHNVHLLVDLCESELFGLDKRLKHDQSRVEELEKQLHDLDVRVQEGEWLGPLICPAPLLS